MKIGKATVPRSAICSSDEDTIVVRGKNLATELIGQVNFGDYFFLLLTGRQPDAATSAVVNATLVAIAEHGFVPSVQAARMTLAAAPEAVQGAVAAGILGCGSVILGASETAGRLFVEIDAAARDHGGDLRAAAKAVVAQRRASKLPIAGYGHPEHKQRDPRVDALFGVSLRAGGGQRFIEIAKAVEEVIPEVIGKDLKLNVSAAIPAVLLGVGFPVNALKGVPMLARTASLIAHLNEEVGDPVGFALAYQATREYEYTGEQAGSQEVIKVLDGVRVLEHGTFITGPAASMLLADLGADVVKVELPGAGDPFRAFKGGLYAPHYQTVNRNKRSITLDTRQPQDLERFDALVKDADVYIQNFRPGFADTIGCGIGRLRGINARLIYCGISGFGSSGPAAHRPAYDSVAQAASAFLGLLVNPDSPRVTGPAIADLVTGFYAAYGILGALYERERTGAARQVELSMFEAMTHFNLDAFQHLFSANEVMGPFSRPSVSQSYVFACADGKWIALHMSSPEKFWQGLASAMDRPNIFQDERFASRQARIDNQDALIEVMGPIFAGRGRDEWCRRLEARDVPHSPMYTTAEVPEDAQARHLQLFVETDHPVVGTFRTVRSPVSFDGQRPLEVTAPPLLGEHNEELRAGWKPRAQPAKETSK